MRRLIAGTIGIAFFSVPVLALAADVTGVNPDSCNQLFNLPAGTVQQSVDQQILMSPQVCAAYQYLYSISTKVNTADLGHIAHLNKTFAVCAAEFFKAYSQKYSVSLQITSAWRSAADQQRVSTSPTSNHTRGLAIDVHPSDQNYDRLRDFAIANKQFGVCFARPPYNGSPDLPHMTAAGIGSVTENCDKYGITKMCDDGGTFDPNSVQEAATAGPETVPLTTPASAPDLIRQYLGAGQQPQTGSVPVTAAQPYPTSVSSPISSPVSTGIPASNGVASNTSVPVTENPTTIAVPGLISDTLAAGTYSSSGTSSQAAIDLIGALAFPTTTAAAVPTGAPLTLNTIRESDLQATPSAAPDTQLQQGAYTLAPAGTQTFTSQDLQYSPESSFPAQSSNSVTSRLLSVIRQVVGAIVSWFLPQAQPLPAASPYTPQILAPDMGE